MRVFVTVEAHTATSYRDSGDGGGRGYGCVLPMATMVVVAAAAIAVAVFVVVVVVVVVVMMIITGVEFAEQHTEENLYYLSTKGMMNRSNICSCRQKFKQRNF